MAENATTHSWIVYGMFQTPERGNQTNGGTMGVFIYFTVLKDVGDTMNLSALPTSCIKKCLLYIFIFPLFKT